MASAAVSLPSPSTCQQQPDLSRHLYVSSTTRSDHHAVVHHSVQTFQEDSLPVAHSLQEGERTAHHAPTPHMQQAATPSGRRAGVQPWDMRLKERKVSWFWDVNVSFGLTVRKCSPLVNRCVTTQIIRLSPWCVEGEFSFQGYLYSAFYDTIIAKQLYRKLSFHNILYIVNLRY